MRNLFTIASKELKFFFISPIAYVVAFAIFIILGILFYGGVVAAAYQQAAPSIQDIIGPLGTIMLFTAPAITMRTLADETKSGTLETLLTAPVRDWEIVVGKWMGAMGFIIVVLAGTWVYPIILNNIVEPGIDQGLMVSNYLGMLLLLGSFLAIGVACSSLFSNQIAAFFATLVILLALWLVGYPGAAMGETGGFFQYLDMRQHFYPTFFRGVIELKDVIYYLSVIVLSLFLGSASVEMRRWR
jgi:ABC-2 type transport system permease protein